MSRHRPPRRESIEDHLRVARARVKLPGAGWTDKLASVPWVEDLIREKIVCGPYPVDKAEGGGRGQRFLPRDYRDLLRIIRLKARGMHRRSAWIAHLWLAGRNYPIDRVRAAFHSEISKVAQEALRDLAPRGRLHARGQPFGRRYDRRIRKRQDNKFFPELVDIIEPLAALGISPRFLSEIGTDPKEVTKLIAETTGYPAERLAPAVEELVAATKEDRNLSPQTQEEFQNLLSVVGRQTRLEGFLSSTEFAESTAQASTKFSGILGTFSPGGESTLLQVIEAATEQQWILTRSAFAEVCSGIVEHSWSLALERVESEEDKQAIRLSIQGARSHRELARGTPWVRLHLFVLYLQDLVQREATQP
jgi:hypothetical protein